MDLVFPCSRCNEHLTVDGAAAGSAVVCPHCSTSVTVPHPSHMLVCPACNRQLGVPQFMTGDALACPACGNAVALNTSAGDMPAPSRRRCLGCGSISDSCGAACPICGKRQFVAMRGNSLRARPTAMEGLLHLLGIAARLMVVIGIAAFVLLNWEQISAAADRAWSSLARFVTPPSEEPAPPQPGSPCAATPSPPAANHPPPQTNGVEGADPAGTGPAARSVLIGQVRWGMSKDNVKTLLEQESKELASETTNAVVYRNAVVCEKPCVVAYTFKNNLLMEQCVAFALPKRTDLIYHSSADDYLVDYAQLRDLLRGKYGDFAEDQQAIDIGYAMHQWELNVQKQEDDLAYEVKRFNDLSLKQEQERVQWVKREDDRYAAGIRYSQEITAKKQHDFDNAQRRLLDRQQERVTDEKAALAKLLASKPVGGWGSRVSRYRSEDCDITLTCAKVAGGVKIVLSYRAVPPAATSPCEGTL